MGAFLTCQFVKIQAKVIGTGEVGYCCDDCRPSLTPWQARAYAQNCGRELI